MEDGRRRSNRIQRGRRRWCIRRGGVLKEGGEGEVELKIRNKILPVILRRSYRRERICGRNENINDDSVGSLLGTFYRKDIFGEDGYEIGDSGGRRVGRGGRNCEYNPEVSKVGSLFGNTYRSFKV